MNRILIPFSKPTLKFILAKQRSALRKSHIPNRNRSTKETEKVLSQATRRPPQSRLKSRFDAFTSLGRIHPHGLSTASSRSSSNERKIRKIIGPIQQVDIPPNQKRGGSASGLFGSGTHGNGKGELTTPDEGLSISGQDEVLTNASC